MRKNQNKQQVKKTSMILATIVLIAISAIIIISTHNRATDYEDRTIEIPINELSTTAQFFEEEIDGTKIKFFAIKDKNEEIKTAFDACDVCFNSKKGYTQDGEYMVCNNCGNRYHVSGLGTENKAKGGCWPSYLPSTVEGNMLIIQEAHIADGKYKFN